MSIAANRFPGIRAALCLHCDMAYAARAHNDANVLVIGAKYTPFLNARAVAQVFMGTHFSNEDRHLRRINKIEPRSCQGLRP
jgi:ribose 5-phosphate isomerase B